MRPVLHMPRIDSNRIVPFGAPNEAPPGSPTVVFSSVGGLMTKIRGLANHWPKPPPRLFICAKPSGLIVAKINRKR